MGKLTTKYDKSTDVEAALDKGVEALGKVTEALTKTTELKEDLSLLSNSMQIGKFNSLGGGTFWDSTTGKMGYIQSFPNLGAIIAIPVSKGDKYYLKTSGYLNGHAYLITDKDDNILFDSNREVWNGIVTVNDEDASWLKINRLFDSDFEIFPISISSSNRYTNLLVENMTRSFGIGKVIDLINGEATYGKYIDTTGNLGNHAYFVVTKPYQVKKGETINLVGNCLNFTVAMISKVISENDVVSYTPLVVSSYQDGPFKLYSYTANENMEVAFCTSTADGFYGAFISNESQESVSKEVVFENNGLIRLRMFDQTTGDERGTFWQIENNKVVMRSNAVITNLHAMERLPVSIGDVIYLKSTGFTTVVRPWYISDDEGNLLDTFENVSFEGFITVTNNNAKWIYITKNDEQDFLYIPRNAAKYISTLSEDVNIKWAIPDKIYAIKNVQKSIYFDNIVNQNPKNKSFTFGVTSTNITLNVIDSKVYFTIATSGTYNLTINAYGKNGSIVGSKVISIEVIDNEIINGCNIVCIGDSITEGQNMPYYAKQKFIEVLTSSSVQPSFYGTKGGSSGMASKDCFHEGWYGRNLAWLAGLQSGDVQSPFVNNNGELDIQYYRTNKLNLSNKIDVVSVAMGWNFTATESQRQTSLNGLKMIIDAFKTDNPDTIFVLQMITFPAMAAGDPANDEKLNSNQAWRELILSEYGHNQDPNIIIGDMGNCYHRIFAYTRENRVISSCYTDTIETSVDFTHPNANGTKELGENLACSLLKAIQMSE